MRILYFCFFFLSSFSSFGQLWIDEEYGEWDAVMPYFDAEGDAPSGSKDILAVRIANDENFLYLLLDFAESFNLQSDNSVTVYIDMDADQSTGRAIHSIGAEMRFNLGNRSGRAYFSNGSFEIFHDDIMLMSLPTVSSNRFELAIRRDNTIFGRSLKMSSTIQLVVKDGNGGDQIPEAGQSIHYSFSNFENELASFRMEKAKEGYLRISSINCLRDQLFEVPYQEKFRRLFQGVRPDIIAFQEIYDHSAFDVAQLLNDWMPLGQGRSWFVDKFDPDVILASKYPILNSVRLDGNAAFLVENGETQLLIINAHLPCCDNDAGRQEEVDRIMSFIRESKLGNTDIPLAADVPIIIAGDLNFVGLNNQRKTMLEGDIANELLFGADFAPDWDGSGMQYVRFMVTGLPLSYTWINNFSSFGPGRLDYIIYTDAVMRLDNSFALSTKYLDPQLRSQYGLLPDDEEASDHLLITADFDLDGISSSIQEVSPSLPFIFPNPSSTHLYVEQLEGSAYTHYRILDQKASCVKEGQGLGVPYGRIDVSSLSEGLYVLRLFSKRGQYSFRFAKKGE